jgi:hypothetical protein
MIAKVKEKITRIKKAAGVEITLLPNNRYRLSLVVLSVDKKAIVIEKKEQIESGNIEVLKTVLDKDISLYLVLNGRGILHKKISESGSDTNNLIQSVLPNAKPQDFYIQKIISEKSCLISIIRKEVADPILDIIENSGLDCTGFSLGGAVVFSLKPLIAEATDKSELIWADHHLETDAANNVIDYKFLGKGILENKFIQVDSERIEEDYLISYAAAFNMLINLEPLPAFVERVKQNKEEFFNKQLFKKMSWSVLVFFLVVLIVNFVLFADFSSKNNELVQKENKYSSMITELETLGKEVTEKESFLSDAGWLQPSSMTYYADRIAATVPSSVKLTDFSINPLDERKSKEAKKELFTTGMIVLKGDCVRPTELNEWLDKIKSIDKINKARLVNYSFDNKENKGSFSIEIETQN